LIPRVAAARSPGRRSRDRIISAMVLSSYGWLGSPKQPVTPIGIVGAAVLVIGVILAKR
jgi:bacterial/archaeal transporter family-2 protein